MLLCSAASQAQNKKGRSESRNSTSRKITAVAKYSSHYSRQHTLFSGNIYSSGYGVLSTQYSKFNHEGAMFLGAYGGWMISHKLMLGAGGYGLVTRHNGFGVNPVINTQNLLRMGYGGLMSEYTFAGNQLFHMGANILIGAGGITNGYITNSSRDHEDWHSVKSSAFFAAQPGVNVEVNITKWFRVAAGGSYRIIAANSLEGISNRDMGAPAANLSFKFGEF